MKIAVVDNVHLIKDKEGHYYSQTVYSYEFLKRYLNVFDEVRFIGKIREVECVEKEYKRVDGPNVEIVPLPWYQGIMQMIRKFPALIKIYKHLLDGCDCSILRIAQVESFFAYFFGKVKNKPFAVEVVNDPSAFTDMPFFYRIFSVYMVKHMCKKANVASYVTEKYLQKKYPTKANYSTYYSSIELKKEDIKKRVAQYNGKAALKIVHVANSINTDIKGHYCLIKAAKRVKEAGYNIVVDFIGDGTKVDEYKKYIDECSLNNCMRFIGRINTREALLKKISEYNLMVLPTKMEGLPRTIIEAMAVGLPCISTPIAGVPELLPSECLVPIDDDRAFSEKIIELINHPEKMIRLGERNICKAKEYTSDILSGRRNEMYYNLKQEVLKNHYYNHN